MPVDVVVKADDAKLSQANPQVKYSLTQLKAALQTLAGADAKDITITQNQSIGAQTLYVVQALTPTATSADLAAKLAEGGIALNDVSVSNDGNQTASAVVTQNGTDFVINLVNHTALNQTLSNANQATSTTTYQWSSDAAKNSLQAAILAAKNVADNASQATVDQAATALATALANLEKTQAKSFVMIAKQPIPKANQTDLTPTQQADLTDALKAANPNLSQVEFAFGNVILTWNDGSKNQFALQALEKPVDKNKLTSELTAGSLAQSTSSYYNASSAKQASFGVAMSQASQIVNDDAASQADVDKAAAALLLATSQLDGKETTKTALTTVIATAQKIKQTASFKSLSQKLQQSLATALTNASAVANQTAATQTSVDASVAALTQAISQVKAKLASNEQPTDQTQASQKTAPKTAKKVATSANNAQANHATTPTKVASKTPVEVVVKSSAQPSSKVSSNSCYATGNAVKKMLTPAPKKAARKNATTAAQTLPQTGQKTPLAALLSGFMLVIAALGISLPQKKRD